MKFRNHQEIVDLVNQHPTRKLLFRAGLDMRFTNRDGMQIDGFRRNQEYSLLDLLKKISTERLMVELEDLETNEEQIVFHGYTSNDLY